MKLLVTGAAGFLGRHVCRHAVAAGITVVGAYRSAPASINGVEWASLDATDAAAVDRLITSSGPDAIIHTAVALAGSLTPLAAQMNWATNAIAPTHVARSAARHGMRLVHISSDAVHRGRKEPYRDDTAPDPIYSYGAAKAAAELGVTLVAPDAAIARVSAIMGDGTEDCELADRERFMLDLASGHAPGVLFTDEVRCPVAVSDLADACLELAANDVAGLLNLAGTDAMSWFEMGELVVARYGGDPGALPAGTHTSAHVSRPGRVVLDTGLAGKLLRTRIRSLREVYSR